MTLPTARETANNTYMEILMDGTPDHAVAFIEKALIAYRNEGLEEAASIGEKIIGAMRINVDCQCGKTTSKDIEFLLSGCGPAIRALKEPQ